MVTYIEPLVKRLSPIRILENTYVELRVKNRRGTKSYPVFSWNHLSWLEVLIPTISLANCISIEAFEPLIDFLILGPYQ